MDNDVQPALGGSSRCSSGSAPTSCDSHRHPRHLAFAAPVAAIGCGVAALPLVAWSPGCTGTRDRHLRSWRDRHAHHREVLLDRQRDRHALPGLKAGSGPTLLTAYTCWWSWPSDDGRHLLRGELPGGTAIATTKVAARSSRARVGLFRQAAGVRGGEGRLRRRRHPARHRPARWSRARCSACSGPRRWRSRPSSAGWARSRPIIGTIVLVLRLEPGLLQRVVPRSWVWSRSLPVSPPRKVAGELVDRHLNVLLFPVGYWLRLDGEQPRKEAADRSAERAADQHESRRARPDEAGRGDHSHRVRH